VSEAVKLLVEFVMFAAPLVPGIGKAACAFFQCRPNLGPVPPELRGFAAVDARIDAEAAKRSKL
jgi:hypothetical protein